MRDRQQELKQFLRKNLYRHDYVQDMTATAGRIINTLFEEYAQDHGLLPDEFRARMSATESMHQEHHEFRIIADYIAGMTDRYAIAEYERITGS